MVSNTVEGSRGLRNSRKILQKAHLSLKAAFPAFKLTQNCYINMNITVFLKNWLFNHELGSPFSPTACWAWKTPHNVKSRGPRKSQLSNSSWIYIVWTPLICRSGGWEKVLKGWDQDLKLFIKFRDFSRNKKRRSHWISILLLSINVIVIK